MILSNVEIHRALDEGRLIIDPEPIPRLPSIDSPDCPYDTHTVDLRLADEISVPHKDSTFCYELTKAGSLAKTIQRNSETHKISHNRPFNLEPK